jgi:hypothetical protein
VKRVNLLLACLFLIQAIGLSMAHAGSDPLANYVRELRNSGDPSFRTPNPMDVSLNESIWKAEETRGDSRGFAARAALPAYLAFQQQLANRLNLSDSEALQLYQLDLPILRARLPVSFAPLAEIEAITISLYTGTTYLPLSDDLASHRGQARAFQTYAATLDGALARLPKYDGTVFHVQDMTQKDLTDLQIGKEVTIPYYLSTSSVKIGWQGNTRMIIYSKSGRDISGLSVNPQEYEVLMPRNLKLRVTQLPVLVNSVYEIHYDEI